MQPFSIREKKKWFKHFDSKIKFYKSLETTKWKDWPSKTQDSNNEKKNKKKKLNKKYSKIKKKAENILETKQVRILVDIEVPPEAVTVLGKGLGFVPTPQEDVEEHCSKLMMQYMHP